MELDEILAAELIRWERFFASGESVREDLFALDSPEARIGLSGVGFLSTRFTCRFAVGRLVFDCECVASGEDDGGGEVPRWPDALATVRLAILLLHAEREGRDWLPNDLQAMVRVASDETGVSFSVCNGNGEVCESEGGWDGLLRMLDRSSENGVSTIWP